MQWTWMRAAAMTALGASLAGCAKKGPHAEAGPGARIQVEVVYPGADPDSVERAVLEPIEESMAAVKGVAHLHGIAEAGVARLGIELDRGVDPLAMSRQIHDGIAAVTALLPSGTQTPIVRVTDGATVPLYYALRGDEMSAMAARRLHDTLVRPAIERTGDVRQVEACGGVPQELTIEVDPAKLAPLGIRLGAVHTAFDAGAPGQGRSVEEIAALPVSRSGAGAETVRLSDVATVMMGGRPDCLLVASDRAVAVVGRIEATADPQVEARLAQTFSGVSLPAWATLERLGPRAGKPGEAAGKPGGIAEAWLLLPPASDHQAAQLLGSLRDRLGAVAGLDWFALTAPVAGERSASRRAHLMIGAHQPVAALADPLAAAVAAVPGVGPLRLRGPGLVEVEIVVLAPEPAGPGGGPAVGVAPLLARLREDRAIAAADVEDPTGGSQMVVELDRERATAAGVTSSDIADIFQASGTGIRLDRVSLGGLDVPAVLRIPAADPAAIGALPLVGKTGTPVRLSDVVSIRETPAPAPIRHEDRQRALRLWVRAAPAIDAAALDAAVGAAIADSGLRGATHRPIPDGAPLW